MHTYGPYTYATVLIRMGLPYWCACTWRAAACAQTFGICGSCTDSSYSYQTLYQTTEVRHGHSALVLVQCLTAYVVRAVRQLPPLSAIVASTFRASVYKQPNPHQPRVAMHPHRHRGHQMQDRLMVISWTFCTHNRPKLYRTSVGTIESIRSRVSNITHITSHAIRERHRSAKANAANGAAIHPSNTTLAKAKFLDFCVHT